MLQALAHACVPILGDAIFIDACESGVFRRVALVYVAEHGGALAAAIDARTNDPAWRACVDRVVMTKSPVVDPLRLLGPAASLGATAIALVPLVAAGKVFGVLGAVRVDDCYSSAELELVKAVARRIAQTMNEAERRWRHIASDH
jgi:GAF domain-containing protein